MGTDQQRTWKPKFSVLGFISGAVWGLGGLVYLQQSGQFAMTPTQAAKAIVPALLTGLIIPTTLHWIISNRPRRSAAVSVAGLVVVGLLAVSVLQPRPAAAQTCSLEVNGQSVTAGTVIPVAETDSLNAKFSGTDVVGGSAAVKYGPITVYTDGFTLAEAKTGDVDRTVDRAAITGKGVGLYQVVGTVTTASGACNYDFFIDVEGDPLTTPAGKAAAGAVALGLLGSLAAIGKEIAAALAALK